MQRIGLDAAAQRVLDCAPWPLFLCAAEAVGAAVPQPQFMSLKPLFSSPSSSAAPLRELLVADIGGSHIRIARHLGGSRCELLQQTATPAKDWSAFCEAMHAAVAPHAGPRSGLSIAIAGVVSPASGEVQASNLPALRGHALAQELSARLGLPVQAHNDADCAALAEARLGVGAGHEVVFGAVLGTGVGGGLVVRGQLVRGAGGLCGEWGHGPILRETTLLNGQGQPVTLARWACGCGQSGCLDTVGGARGLERLHLALNGGAPRNSLQLLIDWQGGEPAACATVAAWIDLISGPLALVVNLTGASVVPVCGGLSRCAALITALDAAVRQQILRRSDEDSLTADQALLRPSVLNDQAGLIGAALAFEPEAMQAKEAQP